MAYQIGICDDEVYQVKINTLMLEEIGNNKSVDLECHGFTNGMQLKKYLLDKELDVLFMDIDLGEESGIELAAELSKQHPKMVIAFITGHREFAEEAYGIDAMGYLVKPCEIGRMERVLQRALLQVYAIKQSAHEPVIIVNDENLRKKIKCMDIVYVQRQQHKSVIVTGKKHYCVYETMTALYERLGDDFLRINQGEIVNIEQIRTIEGNTVKLKNGMEMLIGRTFRERVMERYFGKKKRCYI